MFYLCKIFFKSKKASVNITVFISILLIMTNFNILPPIHCETGTVRNILHYYGVDYSEAMIFGIGEGIDFGSPRFVKFSGIRVIACRCWQGTIMTNFFKRIGVRVCYKRYPFLNKEKSMRDMDALLEKNIPVGILTEVSSLSFIEAEQRFFFNGHSVLVAGKQGDDYLVMDNFEPRESLKTISHEDLKRSRFNLHIPPICGNIYYLKEAPQQQVDLRKAIVKSIRKVCWKMLRHPLSFEGIRVMRKMAKVVREYREKELDDRDRKFFIHIYRMLEIGSGGAGYRFLYADFLDEAAPILQCDELKEAADMLRDVCSVWRVVALASAHLATRQVDADTRRTEVDTIADHFLIAADKETAVFTKLDNCMKQFH